MPRYDYKCPNGHVQEEIHGMNGEPRVICFACGEDMKKQFSPTQNACVFDASDPEGTLWKDSKHKGEAGWKPFIP